MGEVVASLKLEGLDFPITVQGRFSSRNIETDLGSGGPTIRAVTTNSPLTVRRR
jgi:hypothetical protein